MTVAKQSTGAYPDKGFGHVLYTNFYNSYRKLWLAR